MNFENKDHIKRQTIEPFRNSFGRKSELLRSLKIKQINSEPTGAIVG